MFRSKLALCAVILALVLTPALSALAQDDEVTLNLPILLDGDSVEGVVSPDVQANLYVFNGNEGDVVDLTMVQTDALDPYLLVLGPRGEVLAANDDADLENGDLSSHIAELTLPESGSYFVIASSFQYITTMGISEEETETTAELGYTLTITGNTAVEDAEGFAFAAGELVAGEALEGEITAEEPVYYYTFTGAAGDVVDLTAASDTFNDTIVSVFGPGGARLAVNDDVDRDGGDFSSAIAGLELPEDGIYMVMVTNPFLMQASEDLVVDETFYGTFTVSLTAGK
jgi:hypothetical protein